MLVHIGSVSVATQVPATLADRTLSACLRIFLGFCREEGGAREMKGQEGKEG